MTTSQRLTNRVLLVGLEGVEWSALQAMLQSKGLPSLAALLHSGVSGRLIAPAPRIAPSLWTSFVTGQRAHKHGVLHAQQPLLGDKGTCRVLRSRVQTATLGAILSETGLTVHNVGWPISHPAEHLRGVAVSDRFAREDQADSISRAGGWPWVTPPAVAPELFARRCDPRDVEEVTLAELVPAKLVTQPTLGALQEICRHVLAESLTLFRAAKWCMQRGDWDCTICAFPVAEKLRTAIRRPLRHCEIPELEERILAGCYEHLDMLLGQLVAVAGEDATVIVVGAGWADSPSPEIVMRSPVFSGSGLPPAANVLDLTPTILTLLGVPIAKDMDGQPWADLLRLSDSKSQTVECVDTWNGCVHLPVEAPNPASDQPVSENATQDEAVQYLVDLGYTDPLDIEAREKVQQCRRETQRNRALSLLEAGVIDEAIEVLKDLKSRFPTWPSPYELLAETYLQLNRHDLAFEELQFLIHHGAESARLYLALGKIAQAKRNLADGLHHFHVAAQIAPNLNGLHLARGFALLRQGDYENAANAFNQSLAIDGASAMAFDGLATCYLGLQRFEAAAETCLAAVELNMQYAKAHYHLAQALLGLKRPIEARQAFEAAASVDPKFVVPLRWLARICQESLNEPAQAEEYRRRSRGIIRQRRVSRCRAADA